MRKLKNKHIRNDILVILKDKEMTSDEIRMQLLELNDRRNITNHMVGQVLRSKFFEKARVLPTLTAIWKLKEE